MFGLTNTSSGGGDMTNAPIAAYYAHGSGTSFATPTGSARVCYDRDYFTYESGGVFTAKQDCDVVMYAFTSVRHNANSGSSNTPYYKILVNGTGIKEGSATSASVTYSLKKGDVTKLQCHGSTNGALSGGFGIKLAT